MASNRRIRGDCGSVGTPIERDPENQADFPQTPILPLIETPEPDALFKWARNLTMSLEDWFNLLSQAVYDGDDQLSDLYNCYCIRLCGTAGEEPCVAYDCDAYTSTIRNTLSPFFLVMTDEAVGTTAVDATGQVAYVGAKTVRDDLYPSGYLNANGVVPCTTNDGFIDASDTYDFSVISNRTQSPEWYDAFDNLSVHTILDVQSDTVGTRNLVQFECAIGSTAAAQAFGLARDATGTRIQVWNFNWAVGGWKVQSTPYLPELDALVPGNPVPFGLHMERSGTGQAPTYYSMNLTLYLNHQVLWSGSFDEVASTKEGLGLLDEDFNIKWAERNQTWVGLPTLHAQNFAKAGPISDVELAALASAWQTNNPTAADPRPECGPPASEIVWDGVQGISWGQYGHQRMLISDGVVNGKWMLDVRGYSSEVYYTPDNGATFEPVVWNGTSGGRDFHGATQYAPDRWLLMGYRTDQRDHRFWTRDYTTAGDMGSGWTYLGGNALSYNHGYAIGADGAVYSCDGNNNSESILMKMTGYELGDAEPLTIIRGEYSLDRTSTTSHWHTYLIGTAIVYLFSNQGGKVGGYGWTAPGTLSNPGAPSWDGSAYDWRTNNYEGVLFDGITSASNGSSIYSTGRLSDEIVDIGQTAIVGPRVKIQKIAIDSVLPLPYTEIVFPEDVDDAFVHWENGRYIVTARALSNAQKIYFHFGVSGTANPSFYLTIPYIENYPYRDLRYVGGGEYVMANVCQVGSTSLVVVAIKTDLSSYEALTAPWVEDDPNSGQAPSITVPDGSIVYPTPADGDIMVYDATCGGWTFTQPTATRYSQVWFSLEEPTEAVIGDWWCTTISVE